MHIYIYIYIPMYTIHLIYVFTYICTHTLDVIKHPWGRIQSSPLWGGNHLSERMTCGDGLADPCLGMPRQMPRHIPRHVLRRA